MSDSATTTKSCFDCPCRLTADEAAVWFRKGIGSPMCATYGHVLGRPGMKPIQEKLISQEFAKDCPYYGNAKPSATPVTITAKVSIGDPTIAMNPPTDTEKNGVTNCISCRNYVPPEIVKSQFGWSTGMCAQSGRLLLPNKLTQEARGCEYRATGSYNGQNRTDVSGLFLAPIYDEAFGVGLDPVAAWFKRQREGTKVIEPLDYPTDKEVTPGWAKSGVRAWRRIDDAAGSGNFTYLPIFNTPSDPLEAAKVPQTGSNKHPELYLDHGNLVYKMAVCWMELDFVPFLWGIPGTGKTELYRHMAWLMNLPFDCISIKPETTLDDLVGKTQYSPETGTYFQMGRVPKRWVKPGVFLLDEVNCNSDVSFLIRPLADDNQELPLDEDAGQTLARDACCFFGMAANPAWDPRNGGVLPLKAADMSRSMHLESVLPPADAERSMLIVKAKEIDGFTPSEATMDAIMKIAEELRKLSDDGAIPITWGIREQQQVVRASRWFTMQDAYRMAVTNALEPEQAQTIIDIVTANVGGGESKDEPF